jgi:hypothetical protein
MIQIMMTINITDCEPWDVWWDDGCWFVAAQLWSGSTVGSTRAWGFARLSQLRSVAGELYGSSNASLISLCCCWMKGGGSKADKKALDFKRAFAPLRCLLLKCWWKWVSTLCGIFVYVDWRAPHPKFKFVGGPGYPWSFLSKKSS